ncbi:MAG: hypothetical protein KTR31_28780 [Myxococcales bacterium]|nr:hypothetical protein [Myxococcales bacterium]
MLGLWWMVQAAWGAPCPDVGVLVTQAWRAYHDADLVLARRLANRAASALGCQPRVVSNTELLELYWLDAHVALTLDDSLAIDQAIQRAVAVQHTEEGRPGNMVGSRLRHLWSRVRDDQAEQLITIRTQGQGSAWIDGRHLTGSEGLQVAPGLHLIQSETPDGLTSRVRLLEHDYDVRVSTAASTEPTSPEATSSQPGPPSKGRSRRKKRKRNRSDGSAP